MTRIGWTTTTMHWKGSRSQRLVATLPVHRWVALGLLAGTPWSEGRVTVAVGHLWPPGPPVLRVALALAELAALWWIGRWPLIALAGATAAFLAGQAWAWPATTADLSFLAALVVVGARTPRRVAAGGAGGATVALAGFMVASQAPTEVAAVPVSLVVAGVIVAVPTLAGVAYRRAVTRATRPAPAGALLRGTQRDATLTARERMILAMVAEGLTNAAIATELTIGRETVKTHVSNIIAKLGARDRTHAVSIAHRRGLLDTG
jgi:DNA-binding CsgD family transcriptional regulator